MNNHDVLSGDQALDDYFCALLDEEAEAETDIPEELEPSAPELSPEETQPEPELALQTAKIEPYPIQAPYSAPELIAPNLEDVERLLSQLQSTNVVDELDIDDILAQNTIDITSQSKPVVDQVTTPVAVAEEVQDWVVEAPVIAPVSAEADLSQAGTEEVIEAEPQIPTEPETQAGPELPTPWESTQRAEDFQVLYFDVNEVLFAVPLDELGGIHRITELNHLIGKPAWYLGLQTNREQKYDVVDTAKWVMADKLRDEEYKENYQYVVMLGESNWGLASNQLMGTESLNADKVRWRQEAGKRPWLAGMVKEKMCALIHVKALVEMLNAGLDVKSIN